MQSLSIMDCARANLRRSGTPVTYTVFALNNFRLASRMRSIASVRPSCWSGHSLSLRYRPDAGAATGQTILPGASKPSKAICARAYFHGVASIGIGSVPPDKLETERNMMKTQTRLLDDPNYNPNRLLDMVIASLALKNDAALSRALGVTPLLLSKVRHRRLPVGAELMIRIHEATTLSITEIRDLMGDSQRHAHQLPLMEPVQPMDYRRA